jgi:hypothetical protein
VFAHVREDVVSFLRSTRRPRLWLSGAKEFRVNSRNAIEHGKPTLFHCSATNLQLSAQFIICSSSEGGSEEWSWLFV